jgi:uncharacterized membrane protein YdjX (TVP38/TMEM64 family)
MSNRIRIAIISMLAIVACAAIVWLPQANEAVIALLKWVESLGPWGPALFVIIYLVGCVLFLPGSLLTIGAGFLFGLAVGTIAVSIGSTLGPVRRSCFRARSCASGSARELCRCRASEPWTRQSDGKGSKSYY